MKFIDELPELYKDILPSVFQEEIPKESFATCNNCAMVCSKEKEKEHLAMRSFEAELKCCTYFPYLPNYLVGALLSDESGQFADGQGRVLARIEEGVGVTPAGISAPAKYSLLYGNQEKGFGGSQALLCPYYHRENLSCTIWKFRDTVCSTYFCKTVAGANGKNFWTKVNQYLSTVQQKLKLHCYLDLKLGQEAISKMEALSNDKKLTVADLEGKALAEKDYELVWGNWKGKEVEFYKGCYQSVLKLSKEGFNNTVGIDVVFLERSITSALNKMLNIPETLVKTDLPGIIVDKDEEHYTVKYAAIDTTFPFPKVALDIFDGSITTKEAIRKLADEEDMELEEDMLISLKSFGVLKEKK